MALGILSFLKDIYNLEKKSNWGTVILSNLVLSLQIVAKSDFQSRLEKVNSQEAWALF